jgi:hypothetical protein
MSWILKIIALLHGLAGNPIVAKVIGCLASNISGGTINWPGFETCIVSLQGQHAAGSVEHNALTEIIGHAKAAKAGKP